MSPPAQKARPAPIKEFYYLQGSRSQKLIEQRLERIARARALTDELAVLQSHTLRVRLICKELQLLQKTLEQFDERIAEVFSQHPDREIFESLPGAGPTLAPRLLASIGSRRERYGRAANLSSFSGVMHGITDNIFDGPAQEQFVPNCRTTPACFKSYRTIATARFKSGIVSNRAYQFN